MSIILDALKKSENERRRAQRPGFSDLPAATPSAAVPGWAMAAIGALASLVVVLAVAWWRGVGGLPPGTDTPVVAAPAPESPAPATVAQEPSVQTQPDRAVRPLERETRDTGRTGATEAPRSEPVTEAAPEPGSRVAASPLPEPVRPPAGDAAPQRTEPERTAADRDLPMAADLMLDGELSLPQLHMELHVYSTDPARRVVFINGERLREGDELRAGPRLVEILADGAVLSHEGRRFVLPRD